MAQTRFDYEAIEQSATQFTTQKEAVEQVMSQLSTEVQTLEGTWEGLANTAFKQEWDNHKKAMEQLGLQLEEVSKALKAYADNARTLEQQGQQAFGQTAG